MRIAILAWGSLVWQPGNAHGRLRLAGGWHSDGPRLPVEFARISSDGRLTLILVPGYRHTAPVLWARSGCCDVEAARSNLAARETRAPVRSIHGVTAAGEAIGDPPREVLGRVAAWLASRPFDAAIWTGLGEGRRWGEGGFTAEAAVAYFRGLAGGARARAEQYVLRAPAQIDTPVRRRIGKPSRLPRQRE